MITNHNPAFRGINISRADILGHRLNIYKLTPNDKAFTEYLSQNIKLDKLLPEMQNNDFKIYETVFNRGLLASGSIRKNSMLLACDDIPCGIMVNRLTEKAHFVDYICTWPLRQGEKAPFGAKTLFTQMYKDFLESGAKFIELYAIRYSSLLSKYMEMGFRSNGGDNNVEDMCINRERAKIYLEKFNQNINLTQTNNAEDENLFDTLKIDIKY